MFTSKLKALWLALLLQGSLFAAPAQWTVASGGNGHYYEFVATKTNWDSATANASAQVVLGVQGHLASISSLAENSFVRSLVTDNSEMFWLGLTDRQDTVSGTSEGLFKWVDDPATTVWQGGPPSSGGLSPMGAFANWDVGEPNNQGNEDYTVMYTHNNRWNDTLVNRLGDGASYVIEYNVVPEPSAFALGVAGLGLAISSIAWSKRGRRTRHGRCQPERVARS